MLVVQDQLNKKQRHPTGNKTYCRPGFPGLAADRKKSKGSQPYPGPGEDLKSRAPKSAPEYSYAGDYRTLRWIYFLDPPRGLGTCLDLLWFLGPNSLQKSATTGPPSEEVLRAGIFFEGDGGRI